MPQCLKFDFFLALHSQCREETIFPTTATPITTATTTTPSSTTDATGTSAHGM